MYQVSKKDGSHQDYDRGKVVNSVLNAGGSPELADQVAQEVEAWLPLTAVDNTVEFSALKTKISSALRVLNPSAADAYDSFVKPRV